MSKASAIVLVVLLVLIYSTVGGGEQGRSTPRLPVGDVTVAYRQLEGKKLSDMVYLCKLSCTGEACELFTVSLNMGIPFIQVVSNRGCGVDCTIFR